MAGFDITSLLNQLMGKQDPQEQQHQQPGGQQMQPQQPAQGQHAQQPTPSQAMGAAPGGGTGGGGGLGGLLSSGMIQKLAPMIGGLLAGGGLSKLMDQFKGAGMGSQAKSWVSAEQPNQPVTGEQMTQALGQDQISHFANTLGMTNEQAAQTMATTLPQVVDAMTPEGRLPENAAAGSGGVPGGGPGSVPGTEGQGMSQAGNRPQAGGNPQGGPGA